MSLPQGGGGCWDYVDFVPIITVPIPFGRVDVKWDRDNVTIIAVFFQGFAKLVPWYFSTLSKNQVTRRPRKEMLSVFIFRPKIQKNFSGLSKSKFFGIGLWNFVWLPLTNTYIGLCNNGQNLSLSQILQGWHICPPPNIFVKSQHTNIDSVR